MNRQENDETRINCDEPWLGVAYVQLPVNQKTERDEIDDYRRGHEPIAKTGARQTFQAAVIFGHRLQRNAPPKISVNLNVPFIPAGIGGIAPVFLVEQGKGRTEQVMAILTCLTPITATPQTPGEFRARRQTFVPADDGARCALEVEPGEIARPSTDERLGKGEERYQETGGDRVELRFDPRTQHIRDRNA